VRRPRSRARSQWPGRRAGASSALRSSSLAPSSSSQEARCFEFILGIDEDLLSIKRPPDKFTEFVDGIELAEL
jgi:hypothetical protein